MQLEAGKAYYDREGTIWDCVRLSDSYDGNISHDGSMWCRNRKDGLDGLFTAKGSYLFDHTSHDYDLIRKAPSKYVFKDDDTIIADNGTNTMVIRHGDNTYSVLENGTSPHAPMKSAEVVMRALVQFIK